MISDAVKIVSGEEAVMPYLTQIQDFADANRTAFGFLPKSAFYEQACRGRLWLAINDASKQLMGYVLFGGKYPVLKVFQLFVAPTYRKQGVGEMLLASVEKYGEKRSYSTITARVASDLKANLFWDRVGLNIIRQEPGGCTAGRTINCRLKELNTPSLFGEGDSELSVELKGLKNLELPQRPLLPSQTFVLDLNVFFDLVKNRLHSADVMQLIKSGFNQEIRVFVTPEFAKELARHSDQDNPDPILEFANQLPTLPMVKNDDLNEIMSELMPIVFGNISVSGKKDIQRRSDIAHLAYCVHHRATGFITRDRAILAANKQIQDNYYLEVLSPTDLIKPHRPHIRLKNLVNASLDGSEILIRKISERQRESIERFLIVNGVNHPFLHDILHPGMSSAPRRRFVASIDDQIIAIATWDNPEVLNRQTNLYLFVNEQAARADIIIDHFLETALRDIHPFNSRIIQLNTWPEQANTRSTAKRRGFLKSLSDSEKNPLRTLSKYAFSGFISKHNWSNFIRDFVNVTGLKLPEKMPTIKEFVNTGIPFKNGKGAIVSRLGLFDFEILISPAMVLCPGREALIIPIQQQYAKNLFGGQKGQLELFPSPEALLHVEKAYFRHPNRAGNFGRGGMCQ